MEENKVIFEPLPGDFRRILAGGTRTAIKLGRPGQWPLQALINPGKCPFCNKPQEKIDLPGIPQGWWLLPNPMTPHQKHRLIVPNICWSPEKLQELGGVTEIVNTLEICRLATINDNMEIALVIHVGWSTGQNLGHPHWHVCDAKVRIPFNDEPREPARIVASMEEFTLLASGEKPGQVQILPHGPYGYMHFNSGTIPWLASAIHWIVRRGNEKFRSTEGFPPEFAVTVRISPNHYLRYANYCPQLANSSCGFHNTIAALEGGPVPIPWTHETTAAYLRG